jgi:hypothetical protein
MQQTSYQRLLTEKRAMLKAAGLPEEVQSQLSTEAIIEYLTALLRLAAAQMREGGAGNLDPAPATAPATKSIVGDAIAKALLTGNRFTNPNLLADDSLQKGAGEPEGLDGYSMTERIRKRREADGIPGRN